MPISHPRAPSLDDSCLMNILRHCDEPTRDQALQASRAMMELTQTARRLDYMAIAKRPGRWTPEPLPSATELADRGCPQPHWGRIAKAMGVNIHAKDKGPLTQRYALASGFHHADAAGYIYQTMISPGLTYRGGGSGRTPEGYGVVTSLSGQRYEGSFKAGRPDGQGVHTWPSGQRYYEGSFKAGRPDGQGVLTWPSGERYEGSFKAGLRDGQGVHTSPSGLRQEGSFKAGLQDGQGVETWPSGLRYEGSFKAGLPDGRGVMTLSDGQRYRGSFQALRPNRQAR